MKYFSLSILLLIGTLVFGITLVYAIFKSSATSMNNTFTAAAVFPTATLGATPTTIVTPTIPITPTQPATISGTVVINEVMWQGSDEWIELKNTTNSVINISQWIITNAGSGSNSITISSGASIAAGGYYLIAPSKASSTINIDPDQIASLSLLDGGEILMLKTNTNITVDTAFTGTGWFFSSSTPRKSVERKNPPGDGTQSSNWQTATTHTNMDGGSVTDDFGTPKSANGL